MDKEYQLDYYGFSNEDGDGCMAIFIDFPNIKGAGDTFEEAKEDAYENLKKYLKDKEMSDILFKEGIEAFEKGLFEKAYENFSKASKENNANAMVNLAIMHLKGQGCKKDIKEAKKWFEIAVSLDNTKAMLSLAQIYEQGLDGEIDNNKALELYSKAGDKGNVTGQLKAGLLFREKKQILKAMQYLIASAHNNNPQAQALITYVSNAGVDNNYNLLFREQPIEKQKILIENMINQKIKPTLEADSGGIEFVNYIAGEKPQIWLHYLGACSGCHLGSTSTADMLRENFENLIDKNIVLYLM